MFAAGAAEDHGHPCTWCRGPDNRPIVAHGFLSPTIPIRHHLPAAQARKARETEHSRTHAG